MMDILTDRRRDATDKWALGDVSLPLKSVCIDAAQDGSFCQKEKCISTSNYKKTHTSAPIGAWK